MLRLKIYILVALAVHYDGCRLVAVSNDVAENAVSLLFSVKIRRDFSDLMGVRLKLLRMNV
jgi:hypothetical protein